MLFHLLALCAPEDEAVVRAGADRWAAGRDCAVALTIFRRREELLYRLRGGGCDGVLVWLPGALGMESALGVRERDKTIPLIWVSEDGVFALESYRLRVTVFLRAPVTADELSAALARCLEPPPLRPYPPALLLHTQTETGG